LYFYIHAKCSKRPMVRYSRSSETYLRIPVMANNDSEGSRTVIPDDAEQVSG